MRYKRLLKLGAIHGADIAYMKTYLIKLGFYKQETKPFLIQYNVEFAEAVKEYQRCHKDTSGKPLAVDGKIGRLTWDAILRDVGVVKPAVVINTLTFKDYPNISSEHLSDINKALAGCNAMRVEIVKECLKYAWDNDIGSKTVPQALYIFGANLYDRTGKLHIATADYIQKRAIDRPKYFSNGRKEWMLEMVKKFPSIPCSDCSGLEIGYGWKFALNKSDLTADTLCSNKHSAKIDKSALKPGDWVGCSGHIATYVGAGLCVEFAGGSFGCQLTDIDTRRVWDFVNQRWGSKNSWTKFRDPLWYD